MKILSLSLVLLTAAVAQGQKLSEPTWNPGQSYTCPIGKVCRTPTQKEIEAHTLISSGTAGLIISNLDAHGCDANFSYNPASHKCQMTFVFMLQGATRLRCIKVPSGPGQQLALKCTYTPKKAKP